MGDRQRSVEEALDRWLLQLPDGSLYAPIRYIMRLPAKRIRPVAMLMSCGVFSDRIEEALSPALGLELFHNFTLMHDDIMDRAPLRRGQPTVHEKWNINSAILSGDAMLVKAYELLSIDVDLLKVFNAAALDVCEGQQLDMDFEDRTDVSVDEYLEMIRLKTAALLGCALRMGAIIGGAGEDDRSLMGSFGEKLGIAFQLRDDILDAFGDPGKVGKKTGGDLKAGKKTWLLIRALEKEQAAGERELQDQLMLDPDARDVGSMLAVLDRYDVRNEAAAVADRYEREALDALRSVKAEEDRKQPLYDLAQSLIARAY